MSGDRIQVAVVGAGIGGLCLAQGLRKSGIGVAVYERDDSLSTRDDRYRLHIDPAGSRALHTCLPTESWDRFLAAAGRRGGGFGFLDDRLRELAVIDDDMMYPGQDDPVQRAYPIQRADLREVLGDGVRDVVTFGRTFRRYELGADGEVVVWFEDGGSITVDVLIGADGAGSRVARHLRPHHRPASLGALGVGMKVPLTPQVRERVPARLQQGQNMILTRWPFFLFTSMMEPSRSLGTQDDSYLLATVVCATAAAPRGLAQSGGPEAHRAACELMGRHQPALQHLIVAADPDSTAVFPFSALTPGPAWPAGRVTLLGDAVHLMPPTAGLGANTALRDAHLLTRCLASAAAGPTGLTPAIGAYEAEMRRYGADAVRAALVNLRRGMDSNAVRVTAMRAFLRLCGVVAPLRRACFRGRWADLAAPRPWEHASTDSAF